MISIPCLSISFAFSKKLNIKEALMFFAKGLNGICISQPPLALLSGDGIFSANLLVPNILGQQIDGALCRRTITVPSPCINGKGLSVLHMSDNLTRRRGDFVFGSLIENNSRVSPPPSSQ